MCAMPIPNSSCVPPNPAAALEPKTWHAMLTRLCQDLSRPLHSLRAGVDLIRTSVEAEVSPKEDEHLAQMASVCDELLELTRIYLTFSGTLPEIYRPRLGNYSLWSLLRDIDGEFLETARGLNLRWSCRAEGEDRQVVTDASLCQWILRILLDNALEHTRPGDQVSVLAHASSPIRGVSETGRDHWCLQVSDTGTGIAPEAVARLFEPFYRVPRDHDGKARAGRGGACLKKRGLGLGLAVCRAMVQRLGGEIEIASVLGEGTTVTVRLPADPP